jgi:hypothetical protein
MICHYLSIYSSTEFHWQVASCSARQENYIPALPTWKVSAARITPGVPFRLNQKQANAKMESLASRLPPPAERAGGLLNFAIKDEYLSMQLQRVMFCYFCGLTDFITINRKFSPLFSQEAKYAIPGGLVLSGSVAVLQDQARSGQHVPF